ncbi:hypothetical protein [Vreelandella sp. GE22]
MATLNAKTYKTRDAAEAHYLGLVDEWASEKRRIDPAQEAIYGRKAQEANTGGGPWLNAEADALCVDKAALCEQVKAAQAQRENEWRAIEIERLKAKAAVRGASSAAEMHAIYNTLRAD